MREEFEAENDGIVIHTQVRWMAKPRTIRERTRNGEKCRVVGSLCRNAEYDGTELSQ